MLPAVAQPQLLAGPATTVLEESPAKMLSGCSKTGSPAAAGEALQ